MQANKVRAGELRSGMGSGVGIVSFRPSVRNKGVGFCLPSLGEGLGVGIMSFCRSVRYEGGRGIVSFCLIVFDVLLVLQS